MTVPPMPGLPGLPALPALPALRTRRLRRVGSRPAVDVVVLVTCLALALLPLVPVYGFEAIWPPIAGGLALGAVVALVASRLRWSGVVTLAVGIVVYLVAQFVDGGPLFVGVGFGDSGIFVDAADLHDVFEFDFAGADQAGYRSGGGGLWRGGEGDVAFSGEEAGGGVEADPAGAGEIDFGPGVEVGEVGFGAGGAVERFFVGFELDEIARDEAGGEAEAAEELDEEPGAVAAGAAAEG